jgi:hypothetical protein
MAMALPNIPPLSPAGPEEILLPARPWFIVLTLVLALFANLLPLSGPRSPCDPTSSRWSCSTGASRSHGSSASASPGAWDS